MKKVLCLLLVLLAVTMIANAKPAFGIKAGMNLASVTTDPEADSDISSKFGIMLGGFAEMSFNSKNTIMGRGSVMYVQKGWKEEYDSFGDHFESTASVDELVLAPSVVVRFPSKGFTPFIQGGLELGLNLKAEGKDEWNGESETYDFENWSSTNIGFNIGAGGAIPSGKGEIVIDLIYNIGLSNMYSGDNADDYSIKTNGIQLTLGYLFSTPTK
ncbi:PorT family protein [bacterium]|nr:PorT family protein [bacterium]